MHYLNKFDLKGKENSKVEELSKGMGQKIQFIASLIHEPELLVLDEPFSGLDPLSQELFKNEIKELSKGGTAILLSSHQMNIVEELCDRLMMIHKGRKIFYGTLNEIKEKYANFKCSLKGAIDPFLIESLPDVVRAEENEGGFVFHLAQGVEIPFWLKSLPNNMSIQELKIHRISLHEIFIQIATDSVNSEVLNS